MKSLLVFSCFLILCSCQTTKVATSGTTVSPYAFSPTFHKVYAGSTAVYSGHAEVGKTYTITVQRKGGAHTGRASVMVLTPHGEMSVPFKSKLVKSEDNLIHLQRIFKAPVTGPFYYRSHMMDKEEITKRIPSPSFLKTMLDSNLMNAGGEKIKVSSKKDLQAKYQKYTNPVTEIEMSATLSN